MSSIWLSECDPEELRATCPHHRCDRDGNHDAHAWRGSTRPAKFGGVCEVISTYWCEGQETTLDEPERGER